MILVLASASPARRATLRQAGVEVSVVVSGVDEDAALARGAERFGALDTADAVLLLAQAKAQAVADRLEEEDTPGDLVLGCDSLLELDGRQLGKPRDAEEAVDRWRAMRGRTGVLHTGHWLVDVRPDGTHGALGATSSTTVEFADLSDAEIQAYVATGEPLAVAGAFTVDGLGGPFVERIDGDHHNVVGLSLPLLRHLLADVGVSMSDLWQPSALLGDTSFSELRTERLVLRRFVPDDAPTLAAYRSDEEVARYQGWDVPYDEAQAQTFIGQLLGTHPDVPGEWFQLAVTDAGTGEHLGDVALHVDAADPGLARVGITLARAAQGQGYATEALTTLLDYLLLDRGKRRVVADCDVRNTASAALLTRAGLRHEALHRASAWWKGEWTDEHVFAVLRGEWAERRDSSRG